MRRLFSIYRLLEPRERYIWAKIRILHETEKVVRQTHHPSNHPERSRRTILVYNGRKSWIPKSRIYGVRLRKNTFEIYVKKTQFKC